MNNEYEEFKKRLESCKICQEKFGFIPHPIITGNVNAKIVQISQAPSKTVHEKLKPFTDQSGNRLKYEWYKINDEEFYNPNNFYITSIAHCYPGKDKNGVDRVPPKICYNKWVKNELKYINNELYIIIGAKAASIFFSRESFNELIFKDNYISDKLAIVLPHPSPLNIKWFKDHPEFMNTRIYEVRSKIREVLKLEMD